MNKAKAEKIIKEITDQCEDGDYIFRGTNEAYDDQNHEGKDIIRSTFHREYAELQDLYPEFQNLGNQSYKLAHIEKDIVDRVRDNLTDYRKYTNIEILTNLRHYSCSLLLIDFSFDMNVALFFACNSEPDKDGELIMIKRSEIRTIKDINYKKPTLKIIKPVPNEASKNRVLNQKSVFVHAPEGYISKELCSTQAISGKDKEHIIGYLAKYHGISHNTLYNDLVGFIDNEESHESSRIEIYRAVLTRHEKEF